MPNIFVVGLCYVIAVVTWETLVREKYVRVRLRRVNALCQS